MTRPQISVLVFQLCQSKTWEVIHEQHNAQNWVGNYSFQCKPVLLNILFLWSQKLKNHFQQFGNESLRPVQKIWLNKMICVQFLLLTLHFCLALQSFMLSCRFSFLNGSNNSFKSIQDSTEWFVHQFLLKMLNIFYFIEPVQKINSKDPPQ